MFLFFSEHLYDRLCHCPVELPGLLTDRLDVAGREKEAVPSQQQSIRSQTLYISSDLPVSLSSMEKEKVELATPRAQSEAPPLAT